MKMWLINWLIYLGKRAWEKSISDTGLKLYNPFDRIMYCNYRDAKQLLPNEPHILCQAKPAFLKPISAEPHFSVSGCQGVRETVRRNGERVLLANLIFVRRN